MSGVRVTGGCSLIFASFTMLRFAYISCLLVSTTVCDIFDLSFCRVPVVGASVLVARVSFRADYGPMDVCVNAAARAAFGPAV